MAAINEVQLVSEESKSITKINSGRLSNVTESREGLAPGISKREPPVPAAKLENFKKELMEELERKWNNINEN